MLVWSKCGFVSEMIDPVLVALPLADRNFSCCILDSQARGGLEGRGVAAIAWERVVL